MDKIDTRIFKGRWSFRQDSFPAPFIISVKGDDLVLEFTTGLERKTYRLVVPAEFQDELMVLKHGIIHRRNSKG